jgi:putative hydrolase of the HAD superfamily
MSFDLDHTLWDFDKNSEITFEVSFRNPPLKSKHSLKICADKSGVLKLYQYDKISHEELRYNRLRHSFDAKLFCV